MDKERKIAFYTLAKDMWANNADGLEGLIPFYEIKEVFNYIDGRKRRSLKLKSNKACSLESFSMKQDSKDSSILITGLFKSAAYKYRPPYWDTETDEERESPKKQTEGEKEKTLTSNDLSTYDYSTNKQIDLTEEAITNAIVELSMEMVYQSIIS